MDTTQLGAGLEEFTSEQLAKVDEIILKYKSKPGALIPVLEQVQDVCGYLPMSLQLKVAKGLNLPVANVYGVVTFYSFFTMVPRGKNVIRVCLGTACYVRGGKRILEKLTESLGIEPGQCTEDRQFSLETVRCLGACGLAPVVVINDDTHGQMKPAKLDAVLNQYR
ncbi:MAG TPA: NADH-quinone oxidoreductase subunit NuoE [Deltaproteobacteria bacterium]|jgi:NADH-quinone oxidoreductase E subunit|nr:NADH-quinone oxidoreductase subunit NuoE [Deltaproteobacteria bacterium]HQI02774.1 NADH-quinone oxidoreductase subunit NuoE [Deltaproteobacteria bacterium]HQJ09024.1 NADH-quinone oxidoreductase subunit NuoE [Deltaproteobacteria bacterium]